MELIDFNDCPYSDRDGSYGGLSGDKDGIIYNDEYWILKYPKSTDGMDRIDEGFDYTTSPLSEFLGSHVYEILGYDVHKTLLGYKNGKLVVACKDFCKTAGSLREIRTIKNAANKELSELLDKSFNSTSSSSHLIPLEVLLLHFKFNRILVKVKDIEERFWDTIIVDGLINNNDRNNGNWGVLLENGNYKLAPIYDNGGCFSNKLSDSQMENMINDTSRFLQSSLNGMTCFSLKDKPLSYKKILNYDNENLKKRIIKLTPIIQEKLKDIIQFFNSVPESHCNLDVFSKTRKEFYTKGFEIRFKEILLSKYNDLVKENQIKYEDTSEMFQETIKYLYQSNEKELDLTMDEIHSLVKVGIYNSNPNYMKDFIDECDQFGIKKDWDDENEQYIFHLNKDLLNKFDLSELEQQRNEVELGYDSISNDKGMSL